MPQSLVRYMNFTMTIFLEGIYNRIAQQQLKFQTRQLMLYDAVLHDIIKKLQGNKPEHRGPRENNYLTSSSNLLSDKAILSIIKFRILKR